MKTWDSLCFRLSRLFGQRHCYYYNGAEMHSADVYFIARIEIGMGLRIKRTYWIKLKHPTRPVQRLCKCAITTHEKEILS